MKVLVLLLAVVALVGCGKSRHSDLQQYISEVKQRPAGRIDSIPTFPPFESYIYASTSKRSPFDRPIDIERRVFTQSNSDVRPNFNRVKEQLEGFDISSLSMVGTLEKGPNLWALVKDPAGGISRVAQGNYMGQNHGRVVNVDNTKIELIEIVSDGLDGWVERPRLLALSEKD